MSFVFDALPPLPTAMIRIFVLWVRTSLVISFHTPALYSCILFYCGMFIISWRVCPFLGLYILFSFPLYTSRRISLVFRLKFSCLASYLVFAVYPLKIRFVMSSFPLDYSYLLIFFIALLVLIWSVSLVLLPYSFMGDSSLGLT